MAKEIKKETKVFSTRIREEYIDMLAQLAELNGRSSAKELEMIVRDAAKKAGIKLDPPKK